MYSAVGEKIEDFCLSHKEMAGIESEWKAKRSKTEEQLCMHWAYAYSKDTRHLDWANESMFKPLHKKGFTSIKAGGLIRTGIIHQKEI